VAFRLNLETSVREEYLCLHWDSNLGHPVCNIVTLLIELCYQTVTFSASDRCKNLYKFRQFEVWHIQCMDFCFVML